MSPLGRSGETFDHWPKILFEELGHLFGLKHNDTLVEKLIGFSASLFSFAFVLSTDGSIGDVVKKLIKEYLEIISLLDHL